MLKPAFPAIKKHMDGLLFLHTADGTAQIQALCEGAWSYLEALSVGRFDWVKVAIPKGPVGLRVTIAQETTPIELPLRGDFALYRKSLIPVSTTISKPILLVTDLDDTLISIQSGGPQAMERFFQYWISKRLFTGSKLVYSTGRSYHRYLNVAKEHVGVLCPDLVVTGVGSQAFTVCPESGLHVPCEDFYKPEDFPGWNFSLIIQTLKDRFPYITKKPGPDEDTALSVLREIQPHLATAHFQEVQSHFAAQARTLLSGPLDQVRYIDFIPIGGGKRTSVTYAQRRFGFTWEKTMVAGDSGNDIDMLEGPESGVIPANCQSEVQQWLQSLHAGNRKYMSQRRFADALVEALEREEENQ